MTRLEHIYAIKNVLSKGAPSDDFRLSNSLIYHYLKIARSLLLKNKLNKHHNISELSYRTLCVPLEAAPYHDCSCIADEFDCTVLKSTCELPKDIIARWGTTFQVKDLSGNIISPLSVTTTKLSKWSLSNKEAKPGWAIENGKLIIFNRDELPYVLVKAIWEDPEDLVNYCGCGSSNLSIPCYSQDDDFPVDADLVQPMYDLALQRLSNSYNFPEDSTNDARDIQNA